MVVSTKADSERRTSLRRRAGGAVQAIVSSGQGPQLTVRNICCGGLGLEYVVGAHPIESPLVLDLVSWECGPVTVSALACRTAYDVPALSENRSFKGVQIRKRGVTFVNPTPRQKRQLDRMLRRLETL